MGWINKIEAPVRCNCIGLPLLWPISALPGSTWACDDCSQVWEVSENNVWIRQAVRLSE